MRSLLLLGVSLSVTMFVCGANAKSFEEQAAPTAAASVAAAPARPIAAQSITAGRTVTSSFSAADPTLVADGSFIEIYKVQAKAGQRVVVTMRSTAFSPVLNVGNIQDAGDCEACTFASGNDDHQAVARHSVTEDGFVYIRTNTMNKDETGEYTLHVTVTNPPAVTYAPLVFGRLSPGNLREGDAQNEEGKNTDNFSLNLPANRRIQIDLTSEAFDPIVTLKGPDKDGKMVELATDDDAGPGLNSRIRFTTEKAGTYHINISSVGDEAAGAYSVLVGAPPPRAALPEPRALSVGTSVNGIMPTTGPMEEVDGEDILTTRYRFMAQAGQTYTVGVKSTAFDPVVTIGKYAANGDFETVDSDDDSGGGTNALARFKIETAGPYIIRIQEANGSDHDEHDGDGETEIAPAVVAPAATVETGKPKGGAFTLDLRTAIVAPAPAAGTPITLGATVEGALRDGGPRREDDTLYNVYSINLTNGQKITIEMKDNRPENSEGSFDPFLEIGTGTPASFTKISEDDDGGKDLNSRLRFTAPAAGTYLIRAASLGESNSGPYKLSVVTTPPPPPPPTPVAINVGETKNGELALTDSTFEDNDRHYKLYSFNGEAGVTYVIELEATDFDPIVYAKAATANNSTYAEDDDSGGGEGGLNSKLEFKVENAGPQTIRVAAVSEEGVGKFKLKLSRK